MSRIALASTLLLTLGACSTFAPVATGKDSYLIEGGVGLVPPSFTTMANIANEFCEAKRLKMTVLQWSGWVPGRETPKLQFSCTTEASPVHLRPDLGVRN
jgi:hypothetical protein